MRRQTRDHRRVRNLAYKIVDVITIQLVDITANIPPYVIGLSRCLASVDAAANVSRSQSDSAKGQPYREALARLRTAIADGQFAPGQRLIEGDLVQQLESNRAHVRLAVAVLVSQNVLEQNGARGTRIVRLSAADALEIISVRSVLEGLCATQAAERMTPARVAQLNDFAAHLEATVAAEDFAAYSRLNHRLHALIQDFSGNQTASSVLAVLACRTGSSPQCRLALQPGRPQTSLPEHLAILRAIASGDAAAAELTMRDHLTSVARAVASAYGAADADGRVDLPLAANA